MNLVCSSCGVGNQPLSWLLSTISPSLPRALCAYCYARENGGPGPQPLWPEHPPVIDLAQLEKEVLRIQVDNLVKENEALKAEVTRLTTPPVPKPGHYTPGQYIDVWRQRLARKEITVEQLLNTFEHDQANHDIWVRNINEVMYKLRDIRKAAQEYIEAHRTWDDTRYVFDRSFPMLLAARKTLESYFPRKL